MPPVSDLSTCLLVLLCFEFMRVERGAKEERERARWEREGGRKEQRARAQTARGEHKIQRERAQEKVRNRDHDRIRVKNRDHDRNALTPSEVQEKSALDGC